jgi:hypothetical protein
MATDLVARADIIDGGVRALLSRLDLTRTDDEHERMLDALMGVSRAADALRTLPDPRVQRARPASSTRTTGEFNRTGPAGRRVC